MNQTGKIIQAMIRYYAGDVKRINHFIKVYGFAKAIGELEGLDEAAREILEIAAITHDIGIKNSEIKYNSSAGNYQQTEGPPEARKLLQELGVEESIIERVCWLISRHHTYTNINGLDYQILVEADFIVNAYEDGMDEAAVHSVLNKIFRTDTGKIFLQDLYR